MNPIILETMNDIINRVDAREWNRVNEHRFRMTDKFKKEKKKVEHWKNATGEAEDKLDEQMKVNEEMCENWEVATQKIGKENSDLHNEIKRLKKEMRDMKQNLDYWMKEGFGKDNLKIKNQKLQEEIEDLQEKVEDSHQRGFDAGREEYEVDKEYLDEKDDEIKRLKDENEKYISDLMNSSGSFNCEKCNIHLTEDDIYRSVDECEGKLLCESCWED